MYLPNQRLKLTGAAILVLRGSTFFQAALAAWPSGSAAEGAGPMEPWMQEEIDRLVAEYGAVPPPWVVYNEHPYSIRWRMGDGEGHFLVWCPWWPQQGFTEQQRIEYFRKWPPPHCWLAFLIDAIWEVDTFEERHRLGPYFERTSELGFGSQRDYERDLADPKWHERRA